MLDSETAIFLTTLVACVPLSCFYRTIEDVEKRRLLGTALGFLVALSVCGAYSFYTVLLVTGNVIAIKCCDKRYVHKISLMITWMFLLYIYCYTGCTRYPSWLIQTLALRLVGLAFEINIYDKVTIKPEIKTATSHHKVPRPIVDDSITRLTTNDVVAYAYFFVGIHRGPYFTWKTFNDHLNSTVSKEGDFCGVTQQKLTKALLMTLGYIFLRAKYPISTFEQEEFYTNYGSDYRFLFCIPQLVIFYLESQIIMKISTSSCSAAGLGVYPVKAQAVPGAGPTKAFVEPQGPAENEEYNFSMLKCFDNEKILMGPKMKDTMRGWDMPTRYWYSHYLVKNLISNNFEVRSACSFLLWTIWTGSKSRNIIIALTLWVYIHLESEYAQLYAETLVGPWNLGFAIMRMFCLCYLTPCFVLDDWDVALRYYNSIYWIYHIVLAVLTVGAVAVHKSRATAKLSDAAAPLNIEAMSKIGKSKPTDETPKPVNPKDSRPSTSATSGNSPTG